MTIRLQLLAACLLSMTIPVGLGLFALSDEHQLGDIAARMYDQGFMAISFLRSAQTKFTSLQNEMAAPVPPEPSERQRLLAVARGEPAAPVHAVPVKAAASDLLDDLDVALDRAPSPKARDGAAALRALMAPLAAGLSDPAQIKTALDQAAPAFDAAIEQYAQDGYDLRAEAESLTTAVSRRTVAAMGASAIVALVITVALALAIVPSLRRATEIAKSIAEGRLDNAIPRRAASGRNELRVLLRALGQMQEAIGVNLQRIDQMHAAEQQERERLEAERAAASRAAAEAAQAEAAQLVVGSIGRGLERLADGDLGFRLEEPLPGAYEKLRRDLNATLDQMASVIQALVAGVGEIRSNTVDMADAADDLSGRTAHQAEQLEQTARALVATASTMREAAASAAGALDATGRTREEAVTSGAVVAQAVDAMGEIEKGSRAVAQIIGVIDEIAFQTNLLALNAGVEAARAGEAGRGFAVVAAEVRALAQRSAEAAKEIKALIAASHRQVEHGVKFVAETGAALSRIIAQIAEVDGAVGGIAATARGRAEDLSSVSAVLKRMDETTKAKVAMVEQSRATAHILVRETDSLATLAGRFRLAASPASPYVAAAE